ncbi:Hypothetical protein NTJ_11528 [Nesidiocoris tenuis]|uniref:Rhythmically expressed gene 5 protein n=1 Tax=Nesidiocoris tenuis TaxID=355587 RepID=A0ABN7B2S2_9HEMI|nr:Hypothetical protein NTJ_11528 [Nesidiocoris tenuis]
MNASVKLCIVLLAAGVSIVSPSAIPMWEFLSRGEKMSHLFNMFVKQVAEHCDTSDMPDCQKVLLVYGLTNLAKMEDDSLDKMDPYQRGANDIIWESMMHGSYKENHDKHNDHHDYHHHHDHEDTPTEGNHLGYQEEASTNIEKYTPSNRFVVGPMVVRVLPDGSPVPNDEPLPKDEDAEEYIAMRSRPIPSIHDLTSTTHHEIIATHRDSQTSMKRSKA